MLLLLLQVLQHAMRHGHLNPKKARQLVLTQQLLAERKGVPYPAGALTVADVDEAIAGVEAALAVSCDLPCFVKRCCSCSHISLSVALRSSPVACERLCSA